MKKTCLLLLILFLLLGLVSCGDKKLSPPEVESGVRGELGIDKNINEETIDQYLNRDDAVYRDMRMLIDEADYEAIGGDSYLSGFVKGFEVVPYPYLCNVEGLPEAVGTPYEGETLFTHDEDGYRENYEESMTILESLFPKDKYIFLMCGGGGYAGMTKNLLVALGWDENKIYNVGGYWYYHGNNNVEVKYEKDGETYYNFALVNYHDIDFDTLTAIYSDNDNNSTSVDKQVEESGFIKLEGIDDLNELENNKQTFPLFVFLSGCPTCAGFVPLVKEFASDNNVKMYSIDLNDIWGSTNSITDRIKYAPSLFIYKDGEVIAYLDPSSDDDTVYYKEYDKLSTWINEAIDLKLFESKD